MSIAKARGAIEAACCQRPTALTSQETWNHVSTFRGQEIEMGEDRISKAERIVQPHRDWCAI